MARIASLNILLSTTGNDYLAEKYGAVIANVQKRCISQLIKNTNLSGTPGAGTYEANRTPTAPLVLVALARPSRPRP